MSGTVYVGDDHGVQRVLWFSVDGVFYPAVYTLWRNPGIIPLIHCGSNVITRLQDGADLMIPGLIYGPPFPEGARKGAVVAVAGHDRASVPVVVGKCVVDVAGLRETRGVKGVAVETMHWMGDNLSTWGGPSGDPPDEIEGWLSKELKEVEDEVDDLDLEDEDDEDVGGVKLDIDKTTKPNGHNADLAEVVDIPSKTYTTPEIDEIFTNAFLYGINHHKSLYPSSKNFGLDFPLTQTVVMSTLVNPFLPTFTAHDTSQLVIKKTSWKNVRKFIKALDKRRTVKSKDRDGKEVVIVDVDFEDEAVLSFRPYRLPKKEAPSTHTNGANAGDAEENGADSSLGQHLKVLSLYKPKASLNPLFTTTSGEHEKSFYTSAEIKSAVTHYIESQNLVQPNNKRIVKLDPFLANSVFDSSDSKGNSKTIAIDKEAIAKGTIPRDTLSERVLTACAPFHLILRNTSSPGAGDKPRAGAPPKISITLETRSGNKTATKISGLEAFYIPPQPLADELRKSCAGSTSVERSPGSSPKNPVMEVMVQGPQGEAVKKALARRGVDTGRWVEVVDKTKGKKGR